MAAQQQPYITHLFTQLHSSLDFLASQHLLTPAVHQSIISQLRDAAASATSGAQTGGIEAGLGALSVGGGGTGVRGGAPGGGGGGQGQGQGQQQQKKVKATYDYAGSAPDDLPFRAGDIITIVEEPTADWWKGELGGRVGLFPVNHTEVLPAAASSSSSFSAPPPPSNNGYSTNYSAPAPPPPQQQWQPPPPPSSSSPYAYSQPQHYGSATSSVAGSTASFAPSSSNEKQAQLYNPPPPPPPASFQQQQPQGYVGVNAGVPPPVAEKKSKFGGVGKTVGHAFAGGAGFGVGSALTSNAINAIF